MKKIKYLYCPDNYKIILDNVVLYAREIFKDNLVNVTLGGSGGKGNIIEGWSDLDIYIILNEYNISEVVKFMNKTNKMDIHIGTTFYTLDEVENGMIDSKTKVMCYELQNFEVNPILYGENVFKPIEYREVVENDVRSLPNILHDFRRRYIALIGNENAKVSKEYIKKMLVLIKCILNYYGVFSYGYDVSVANLMIVARNMGYELTPFYSFDIISSINNLDNSKADVVEFSRILIDFIEFSYKMKGERQTWTRGLVQGQ